VIRLTSALLLQAYAAGIFPMAESADDPELFWVDPRQRGILPLDAFHVPRRLQRVLRRTPIAVRCDTAFEAVMRGCAEASETRPSTWINDEIVRLYSELAARGAAHSVECWQMSDNGSELVGGLYGVSLGAVFYGESMFSRVTDASKIALVHLVARLRLGDYRLLDTQFLTPHLVQFGGIEVSRARYHRLLAEALRHRGVFVRDLPDGLAVAAAAAGAAATGGGTPLHSSRLTS
jgi:leucyl/phenylalanyl-tRNA--protein transferase